MEMSFCQYTNNKRGDEMKQIYFYGNTAQISFNSYPGCGFEVIIEIKVEEIYVSDISCRR